MPSRRTVANPSRGPAPIRPRPRPRDERQLHRSHKPTVDVPARSQRTPPAQTRLVRRRPGTLHTSLPERPCQRSGRTRGPGGLFRSRARGRGIRREPEQEHPLPLPRRTSLVGQDPAHEYVGNLGSDGRQRAALPCLPDCCGAVAA